MSIGIGVQAQNVKVKEKKEKTTINTKKKTKAIKVKEVKTVNTPNAMHPMPELAYKYDALEAAIDAKTVEIHFEKHTKGYYKKFLKAIKGTKLEKTPIQKIFNKVSNYDSKVRNAGGGYYNHVLYWENLGQGSSRMPDGKLLRAIERDFGSFEAFKKEFSKQAKGLFGSGWTWLSIDKNGKLFISTTNNQDNPLMDVVRERGVPILAIDIWEHSYYLRYQNKRGEHIDNIWKIINWDVVERRYKENQIL
jgi:Fe-Mn family superoxide dismutase